MLVAIDFETSLKGEASLQAWHPDFRIDSCSFSWRDKEDNLISKCVIGESEILAELILHKKNRLIAHNLQYELACWKARFPYLKPTNLVYDTARMAQQLQGSGLDAEIGLTLDDKIAQLEKSNKRHHTGLGLQSLAEKWLEPIYHNHKEKFYAYLREKHFISKGNEGKHLHLLPLSMLKEYNNLDTEVTLRLFEVLKSKLQKFPWGFDHKLHVQACDRITTSYLRGIRVNRVLLSENQTTVNNFIDQIDKKFKTFAREDIRHIMQERLKQWLSSPSSERGKKNRLTKFNKNKTNVTFLQDQKILFNTNSTKQLKELFVDKKGIEPLFWTKPQKNRKSKKPFIPSPSFRATHLHTYGEGGKILENQKKLGLVSTQMKNLDILSREDGRWHANLNALGTKTYRYTGSSDNDDYKLNCQGLARRNQTLMECLIPDDGNSFVSIDLTSGEPTVTAHYTQDKYFNLLNFGMVGKKPYLESHTDLLIIDDTYLAGGSIHPTGRKVIKELTHTKFNGLSFYDQWVEDREVILRDIKIERGQWKATILALLYGQGPRGMVDHAYNHGFELSLLHAKDFHYLFWHKLFPDVRKFGEMLSNQYKRKGVLINDFRCRLYPESAHKCLNYWNQSSVSGIMKLLESHLYSISNYIIPHPPIHDELILELPTDRVEDLRLDVLEAVKRLNDTLNWRLPIRTGFVVGKDLYEAK